MMHGFSNHLSCKIFVLLLTINGGLVGCNAWPGFIHNSSHMTHKKMATTSSYHKQKVIHKINRKTFWNNLQKDFTLSSYSNKPSVQTQIQYFLQRPYQLCNTISRSAPYIYYVYEQVKKRHLPTELVLLPFVESTYNPLALNKLSGASGLWQLTPRTAQKFGVRQNAIFDGKRDLDSSTHAALDYLAYLNQLFSGDWLLTLAAYDAGEGHVKRAIRYNTAKNLKTHFWELPLALETVSYVPKLLALSAIIKNPKKYGLELPVIHEYPYLESVEITAGVSLAHAAVLANSSLSEIKRFNPGFKQSLFIPKQPYHVLLPIQQAATLKKNLTQISQHTLPLQVIYYKTKPGDTLNRIAKRYHTTVTQICEWNGLHSEKVLPLHKPLIIIQMPFPILI